MRKVKFDRSPSGAPFLLGYHIDDEASLEDAQAESLVKAKMAHYIDKAPKEKAIDPNPKENAKA